MNSCSVYPEIHRILRNHEVLYPIHKYPPLVLILLLHSTSLRSIIILPSYLSLGFQTGLFPSGFTTEVLHLITSSLACVKRKVKLFLQQAVRPHMISTGRVPHIF
jgi:hypothetical protein